MCCRKKRGLELRRRPEHACVEPGGVEASEALAVSLLDVIEGAGLADSQERGHHAAHPPDGAFHTGCSGGTLEAGLQTIAEALEAKVEVGVLAERVQRRDARRHRERAPRERSSLVHRTGWCDLLHEAAPAAIGANRKAAADHLAEEAEIGIDPVERLGSAICHAK